MEGLWHSLKKILAMAFRIGKPLRRNFERPERPWEAPSRPLKRLLVGGGPGGLFGFSNDLTRQPVLVARRTPSGTGPDMGATATMAVLWQG